ncbi:MAG TPA: hypothetical protein VJW20_11900 [Candidatus Angelobacter sp.]|nr:hypothetical protein [Candidatus Angelobacter sp.]
MLRFVLSTAFYVFAAISSTFAQVQTVGDVSFSVPDGWQYAANAGGGFGMMTLKQGNNFWAMTVFTPWQSSGNANTDFNTAWQKIVLAGGAYSSYPLQPYYDIAHTVGYPGKRADASSINRATYTRLYVLEAGRSFVPVVVMSNDGMVLNSQEYVANALLGSVRVAPLKATPVKTSLTLADLAGEWKSGMASSLSYHSSVTGQYQGSSSNFTGGGYHIAANGAFTYKMTGMIGNNSASDADSGVVELGGEFITFRGRNHVVRYRFLNIQTALDGSTVLTLLPPGDMAHISIIRDSEYLSRPSQSGTAKK